MPIVSDPQPQPPTLLRPAPRVAAAVMLTTPSAALPQTQTQAGQWISLLLAIACTVVIVALFATPLWLPHWRRWHAVARSNRNDARLGSQRFAAAIARGDFDQAETEAKRLLDRG